MVKLIEDNYCVDTAHIVTAGFSYGGGMSYELACARAKVFHAAVVYEGGQLSGCDGGNDPIALWQTEGLTDTTVSHEPGDAHPRSLREERHVRLTEPAPARSAAALPEPGGPRLHGLLRMLGRTSRSLVRPPVRPHPGSHRRNLGPLQFVRHASQDLLHDVPLHLDARRCLVLADVFLMRRLGAAAAPGCRRKRHGGRRHRRQRFRRWGDHALYQKNVLKGQPTNPDSTWATAGFGGDQAVDEDACTYWAAAAGKTTG